MSEHFVVTQNTNRSIPLLKVLIAPFAPGRHSYRRCVQFPKIRRNAAMKPRTMVLALAIATLAWSCSRQLTDYSQTVNSRLGDVSFVKQFGHPPDASTDENLRIRTHLEYVENLL